MKTLMLMTATVFLSATPALAQTPSYQAPSSQGPSPQGDWSRGDGKAKVTIAPCGDDLCAINTWIKTGTKDEKVGDRLIMSISETSNGKWTGKASDPQRKLNYRLTLTVAEQNMTTSGCVLGGLICKKMNWTRIG